MSWQNVVVSLLLRLRMKPISRRAVEVGKVRALAGKALIKPRLPPGWRIRAVETPLAGEWIERIERDGDGGHAERARTLLYLHGGGYFFCSPKTHRPVTVGLAMAAEARCLVPAYRLAPEHPFPAAIEDAVAAYRRLRALGTPAERIVIAGDSAGGGLALATLLSLRDAGDRLPAAGVLFSPWTDLAATGASIHANSRRDVMFHGDSIARAARHYLGDVPPTHPLASPLYADLSGLPPLFVQASNSEVLLDDSTRLAERALRAGVEVSFTQWHRVPHAWHLLTPFLPEARAALAEAGQFVRRTVP